MSESMGIRAKIDEIIAARKARKTLLDQRIQDLDAAIAVAERMDELRRSVVSEDGTLLPQSPYYDIFADNVKMLSAIAGVSAGPFIEDARKLREGYEALNTRFQRDFINIAVVGPARQGKSRLLQSISGLDSRCIPAFDGDHCTGARSVVENGSNQHVRACIAFKTQGDVLQEVQEYLNTISNKTEHIYNIDDLPNYTADRLKAMLEKVTTGKSDATAKMQTLYNRYVEHYSEWRGLIGRESIWLENEDEIISYVAQHNGKNPEDPAFMRFYKFVGVKLARIEKAFTYDDAGKIRLVDTVGLGATDVDTNQRMLETIKTDSDAVVFFKFPDANTGGSPLDTEIRIFDEVRTLFEKRQMEKWFAFLLNHSKDNPEAKRYDNISTCRNYKAIMDREKFLPAIMNQIVDVTDADEVRRDFLVPLLQSLSDNLGGIDQLYVDELSDLAGRTWRAYDILCKSVEGMVKYSVGGNLTNDVYKLIQKTYDGDMTVQLKKRNLHYGALRNEKCEVLCERIDHIVSSLMDHVPQEAAVQEYMDTHGLPSVAEVYKHFLDAARSDITQQFIEVDTSLAPIITAFKNEITGILVENGRLGKVLTPSGEGELFQWLHDFSKAHLESDSQIRRACEFLYDFDFSVRGALMNKVRLSLYEISLANPNMINVMFQSASARSVVFQLKVALKRVQDNLKGSLRAFYMSPNEALFAVCDEFFERITTSEGVYDEWFALYSGFAGRIWSKELMASQKNGAVMETWAADIEQLQKYNRKDSFILSLE